MKEKINIGNGQGFWGDSIEAPIQLIHGGDLDYLTLDYLAEVTMSIMQRQKRRNPNLGYAHDFVELLEKVLPTIQQKKIKIIANAGGVNPKMCAEAILAVGKKLGIGNLHIGVIEGDDILDKIDDYLSKGIELKHLDTGESLQTVRDKVLSANVYISTFALVEALRKGADVIVAGRATDPGLALAPLIYEFGWKPDDWNKLAAGTVAGHIIECGAQTTGGNYTRWWEVPNYEKIGYPIIEAYPNGDLFITKHPNTGGLVSVDTVAEQVLYEMGDPKRYISPDVIVDFTSIKLESGGKDRVKISGVTGAPNTDTYKVSIGYLKGYKASGTLTVSGPDAYEKAKLCANIIWKRLENAGYSFEDRYTEFLGVNSSHGEITEIPRQINEVVLRVSVKDPHRSKVERFGKELAPLVTNGPPGVTGFAGGRPKPQEIIAFWPALIPKKLIHTKISIKKLD